MLVVILDVARRPESILHVAAVFDLTILTIHDELNIVFDRHMQRKIGLPVDKRLKRVTQMFE